MIKLLEHTRRPDITFHRNGIIRITARVARILSLRPGDSINVAVSDGEYLLHAVHRDNPIGRYETQCYRSKRGGENYCANSVRLCRSMLSIAGCSGKRVSFMVGERCECEGVVCVPIITLKPL